MSKLIIVRHHESEWNKLGKWTGLTDVSLTEYGREMSQKMGALIRNISLDQAFTSAQIRTQETLLCMQKEGVCLNIPVVKSAAFNERDYGDYTGKNKWEMQKLLGDKEFEELRRGWNYAVPHGETLKMVYERVVPYYLDSVLPLLNQDKSVIIVAHGNSLRALIKYIEDIPEDEISRIEMPFGSIFIYDIDGAGRMIRKEVHAIESKVNA